MNSLTWVTIAMMGAALVQLCSTMDTTFEADQINNLPGQPEASFKQFSGYITVDEKQQRALFYYLVEAETDPESKPLVLWLNGGPACSSVGIGAFSEHGPFKPKGGILVKNEHSWNKEANMLYLDSPAGVGFSYSANTSFYIGVDDQITASDNLMFMQRFFLKFPQYKNRDLFVTGESYAGHYVPQLAQLMLEFNKKEMLFNLKGIAMGNPLLEFYTDFNSEDEFLWSHGLISDSTYGMLTSTCNSSRYVSELIRGKASTVCSKVRGVVDKEISNFTDKYDVTLDVCLPTISSQSKFLTMLAEEKIDVCVHDEVVKYLNRDDVQKALHAHLIGVTKWSSCNRAIKYKRLNLEISAIPVVGSLVKSGIPVLVFSGDQDSVLPFVASRTLVNELAQNLGLNSTVPYRAWFEEKQVAGWTQVYGNILSFATIRGASHAAPFSQPERSLELFKAFIKGKPLPETF